MSDSIDRRKEDPRFKKLFLEVGQLKSQHQVLSQKLDINTAATLKVEKNTADIVDAWKALSGGLKVLGVLGSVAKWFAYIAGAITASGTAWYALTHWGAPPPPDLPK